MILNYFRYCGMCLHSYKISHFILKKNMVAPCQILPLGCQVFGHWIMGWGGQLPHYLSQHIILPKNYDNYLSILWWWVRYKTYYLTKNYENYPISILWEWLNSRAILFFLNYSITAWQNRNNCFHNCLPDWLPTVMHASSTHYRYLLLFQWYSSTQKSWYTCDINMFFK